MPRVPNGDGERSHCDLFGALSSGAGHPGSGPDPHLNIGEYLYGMETLVYIGAGTDCIPLIMLDHIQEFIYVDSRPQSEFGMDEYDTGLFYRGTFLPRLEAILRRIGFELVAKKNRYLEFRSGRTSQVLRYYSSTAFPEMLTEGLATQLARAQYLYLAGFDPHKIVLTLMPNLKSVYCNMHTVYDSDEYADTEEKGRSTFYELCQNRRHYSYWLVKELAYWEYWEDEQVSLELKKIHRLEPCEGLKNYYLERPKEPNSSHKYDEGARAAGSLRSRFRSRSHRTES